MTRIILHVGHGKTGTTALQSSFARSVDALAKAGVYYPAHPTFSDAAAGRINSGNVSAKKLIATAAAGIKHGSDAVLLSNEMLFHDILADEEFLPKLTALGAPVDVILFVRNPLSHAISSYGQTVKRGGSTDTLEDYLPRYRLVGRVAKFIALAQDSGARLHILNYSNLGGDLLASFAQIAGFDPAALQPVQGARINRSLTRAESHLQRAFNGAWGAKSSQFISDALCNALPDIPSETPVLSRQGYKKFAKMIAAPLARANALLPPSEQLVLEPYRAFRDDANTADTLAFAPEQIDVLAAAISARIPHVLDNDAFRDFVITAQTGTRLKASDVAMLTEIALKLRPDAPMLVQKHAALTAGIKFVPDRMELLRTRGKRILRALGLY